MRPDAVRQTISATLNKLRKLGLVDYTVLPASNRSRARYLTGEGARLTRDFPALRGRPPYPITSATAASLKTPHTLTVAPIWRSSPTPATAATNTAILDSTPEVSHPLSDGEKIITDAVMHDTLIGDEQRTKLRAFVEIDRATMSSERLAEADRVRAAMVVRASAVGRPRSRQPAVP